MEWKETRNGDITVVELFGKIDASNTPGIESKLVEKIRGGQKYLAVDFGGVTYLASSGLRMLLVVVRLINELEGKLILSRLDQTMKDTLEITGFLPYFQLAETQESAFELLK